MYINYFHRNIFLVPLAFYDVLWAVFLLGIYVHIIDLFGIQSMENYSPPNCLPSLFFCHVKILLVSVVHQ